MKKDEMVNGLWFVGCKRICRVLCALLCAVFAFSLVGCGNTYTDEDDYANFVRWQSRYETEKKLVALLRDYDAAYTAYGDYTKKASGFSPIYDYMLAFTFEGSTVLTEENVKLMQVRYNESSDDYSVIVTFDSVGTAIFAKITAENIGGSIEIVEICDGSSNIIVSPSIDSAITNGIVHISGFTEASANEVYMRFSAKTAERSVRNAASAYNDRRSEIGTQYPIPDYLPASLSVIPEYTDATAYLQKAQAAGFIA